MKFFLRQGSMMRIITLVLGGGVIFLILIIVVLRATDGESGSYENVTKTARNAYSAISADGNSGSEQTTNQGDEREVYQTELTVAQEVAESPDEGLNVPAMQLLPSRVEGELPIAQVAQAEQEAMGKIVDNFLATWETFTPADSEYGMRLQRVRATATGIVSRRDNRQQDDVGPCSKCTIGSQFRGDQLTPSDYMIVRGYTGDSAYVTTEAVVEYDRSANTYHRRWRREYALILSKSTAGWYVARAIAETKGPEE